eukprot:Awhi_evm1s3794
MINGCQECKFCYDSKNDICMSMSESQCLENTDQYMWCRDVNEELIVMEAEKTMKTCKECKFCYDAVIDECMSMTESTCVELEEHIWCKDAAMLCTLPLITFITIFLT